jgi:hypothetical protein
MYDSLFARAGISECQAWREMAYASVGVRTPAWNDRPKPMITILNRGSRGFFDLDAIVKAVNATGLPWQLVSDIGRSTYKEQVQIFANTAILVATHGGALAHVMHLPLHAVIIEMFPYMVGNSIYEKLAHMCNVHYYKLLGSLPPEDSPAAQHFDVFKNSEFLSYCEYPHHMGRYDGALIGQCDRYPKNSAVHVPLGIFETILSYALSDIGCRDSVCRAEDFSRRTVNYKDYRTGTEWTAPLRGDGPADLVNDAAKRKHYSSMRHDPPTKK